jgi:hypothetical protein
MLLPRKLNQKDIHPLLLRKLKQEKGELMEDEDEEEEEEEK